jgi:HAD superfamily hydrolase (TIGR01549 family)
MPVQNLFLDAGGVILEEEEHERARAEIIIDLLTEHGFPYSLEDYQQDVEEGVRLFVPNLYAWILWKRCPEDAWYAYARTEMRERWRERKPPLKLMSGLSEVLPGLSNSCRIGILGQYGSELTEFLDTANLLRYFSFRSTQDGFAITKPDPRYFEQILEYAGVKPEASIMVGDRIDKDVIPAKTISMKTIRMRVGLHRHQEPRTPDERPDAEISRLEELPMAVQQLLGF